MDKVLKSWLGAMRVGVAVFAAAALFALAPTAAHADTTDPYGTNVYGGGVYGASGQSSGTGSSASSSSGSGTGSNAAVSPTVVQTPSGLDVAINLTNNQTIPAGGYTITITPTNGQGQTFDKAEIYLDGKLAFTGTPDSTGTLSWLWDTTNNPASTVKITIYGPGSGTTTHEFNVTVTPPSSTSSQSTSGASSTPSTPAPANSAWPAWIWWVVGGAVLLIILLVIWLVARRRGNNQGPQQPPTTFTPM